MLRALALDDLDACLLLDAASLSGFWTPAQWRSELADARRPGVGHWQDDQLRAMACGWLVLDELHITLVAVAPPNQRQGLGRQVLGALLAEGRRLGAVHATLEVAATNLAARALYATAGFQEAGRRRGYYRNGDDALIQWRRLMAHDTDRSECG
jgi:ribosomal-protein-alanine N-acetyltransferase